MQTDLKGTVNFQNAQRERVRNRQDQNIMTVLGMGTVSMYHLQNDASKQTQTNKCKLTQT